MVAVTGTVFDLRWQASEEILEVEMHDGAVVVSGPLIPDELKLRAQERLTVNARAQTINIRRVAAEPEPAAAPLPGADGAESPARQAPPNRLELARAAPSGSVARPSVLGLAELLAAGQPAAVLARAETRGIDWCLANASSDDLAALADAARYGRRIALAERALLSTRQRFPGTRKAREATFFLGTNAEASSPSDAVRWYDQYLKEDGAGTYAREALGRELALLRQLGGNGRARPAAEDYLRKYPTGPYASVARSIIDGQ